MQVGRGTCFNDHQIRHGTKHALILYDKLSLQSALLVHPSRLNRHHNYSGAPYPCEKVNLDIIKVGRFDTLKV